MLDTAKANLSKFDRYLEDNIEIVTETGCWIWTKAWTRAGYGQLDINKKRMYTHRLSYEKFKGLIPEGMIVCHKCDTPSCCNPDHLFVGTFKDNTMDKIAKGRQPRGEELSKRLRGKLPSGDNHWSRRMPERRARGEKHSSAMKAACKVGEERHNSKLKEQDVRAIRQDTREHKYIASDYGVTPSCISAIKTNRSWRHI